MTDPVQLWSFGVAALVDTVLLLAFVERPNRRAVTVWMLLLAFGVWCWHSGTFVRLLVDRSVGPLADPVRWASTVVMTFGLLLMPSATLHGTWRLFRHGEFRVAPQTDPRLALCYLPLLALIPMSRALAVDPSESYLSLLAGYRLPYVTWLCVVSGLAIGALIRSARLSPHLPTRRFYWLLAGSLLLIAVTTTSFVASLPAPPIGFTSQGGDSPAAFDPPKLQTVIALSPLLPSLLFAYFIMRFQLLPLVLEGTLVYGALLMGAVLFHQVVLREFLSPVEDRYRLNVGVLEGIALFAAIVLYQPLRQRFSEALQSLFDSPFGRRGERQRLAVQLAARAGDSPANLMNWFAAATRQSFDTPLEAAWLCQPDGRVLERSGHAELLPDADVASILKAIGREPFVTRHSARDPRLMAFLDEVRAGALLKFEHPELSGLFLVGCRGWGQPPSDEDLHSLSLLVEQFGVTLHNSQLLALQVAAEHRVLQQDKLSTLGLLAGSLAHEIKNPLSSIKTITRVLAEELGPQSPHAEDLRMIGDEVERLTASTSELLDAARPPRTDRPPAPLDALLSPTLRLLQHLARERRANLDVVLPESEVQLSVDQIGLREIVFNLTSNALEAAGAGGRVRLSCRSNGDGVLIEIDDNGPGFPPEQLATLFQPFFTTKPTGTGLGLYIVARRVKEIGGRLDCRSQPNEGTTFTVQLPR